MRTVLIALIALAACGPTAGQPAKRPVPPAPPKPAYEVAHGDYISMIAADATHVYWFDGGIWRHPHGAAGESERLWASDSGVYYLGVGADDVFFIDDANILRALPKAGGVPSELTTFDGQVWGMHASGNGVWVGVDSWLERWSREPHQKKIALPRLGTYLAVADHTAYVASYDESTLVSVDLKTRKVTEVSNDWFVAQASALAVSGPSLLLAYPEGVLAVPRTGGAAKITFPTPIGALAADGDGYVVLQPNAIVDHQRGRAPRVIATSDIATNLAASPILALGGGYAYHVDYDQSAGGTVLRGSPRGSGPRMLRLPLDAIVNDVAVDGDQLYASLDDPGGSHIARLGSLRTEILADLPGYADRLFAGDGEVAFLTAEQLMTVDRGGSKRPIQHDNAESGSPLAAVHHGLLYWVSYMQIWAVPVAAGARPVLVADASSLDGVAGDLQIGTIEFATDHLYFTLPYAGLQGLARVDERHHTDMLWTYARFSTDGSTLASDFTIIGDTAYAHDTYRVFAIPLDGSAATTLVTSEDDEIVWVDDAGSHLVAWTRGPDGEQLVEIDRATGKRTRRWRSNLDGGSVPNWDVGPDTVYLSSPELRSVLAIDL
jgi:hypothetical protein